MPPNTPSQSRTSTPESESDELEPGPPAQSQDLQANNSINIDLGTVADDPAPILQVSSLWVKGRTKLLLGIISVLTLLIAAFTLWPTIAAGSDGREARELAEWTAEKDFLESCESVRIQKELFLV
ncbi:hypothetical protein F5Y15DRAFT_327278 [Xylariaceae sp. FL0016]|nr:hypothetical protein F5Y15DRAFT_327278 [Xylariaceae sp. FL0016]